MPSGGWDDLVLVWDEEFLQGDPFNVAITSQHNLALATATLTVYSVDHIHAKLDAHPDQIRFEPPADSVANTEPQRPWKLCPIPFKYVALFLTSIVTPGYYFTRIYPQIVVDGLEEACRVLAVFMQACITRAVAGADAYVTNSANPMPPARNDRNRIRRDQLFDVIFHAHSAALVNISHDGIRRKLSLIKDQGAWQHEENTEA